MRDADEFGIVVVAGSGTTTPRMEQYAKSSKAKIVVACEYVSHGYDDPSLAAIVFALVLSNVRQVAGRVERENPADPGKEAWILDIVDNYSIYESFANSRLRFYESRAWAIQNIGARVQP